MARRVARHAERLELEAGELERFVSLQQEICGPAACFDAGGNEVRQVFEQGLLVLGHVDRGTGALGQLDDAKEVVPVAMRDQNRRARRAQAGELDAKLRSVPARVDHDPPEDKARRRV